MLFKIPNIMNSINKVIRAIKSVCPDCKCKGQVIINSNINLCEKCKGKGYQTYEELLKEIE